MQKRWNSNQITIFLSLHTCTFLLFYTTVSMTRCDYTKLHPSESKYWWKHTFVKLYNTVYVFLTVLWPMGPSWTLTRRHGIFLLTWMWRACIACAELSFPRLVCRQVNLYVVLWVRSMNIIQSVLHLPKSMSCVFFSKGGEEAVPSQVGWRRSVLSTLVRHISWDDKGQF